MARRDSSLSDEQRASAVALFESGYRRKAVAAALGVRPSVVHELLQRWQIRGQGVLVDQPIKRTYSFELKYEIVQRFLAGETKGALAVEYGLSSPELIKRWARSYRAEGVDGLRPRPRGRPTRDPAAPGREESEVERLRRENERLRAEVAYLGKLKALRLHERR